MAVCIMKSISEPYTFLKNRTKLVRKRSAHRFKIFLKYHLKKESKEPVFIITTRRTGSNLLLDYLNSIPNVFFAGEVLNRDMAYGLRGRLITKRSVLRHIAHSINNCEHKICGAKFVKVHLDIHNIGIADLKKLFPNARFIVLYRQSLLEQFVSLKIAEITDTWHWKESFALPPSIHVSVPEFKEFCKQIKRFYGEVFESDLLNNCSTVISYEELQTDPQKVSNETIFPFLGLRPCAVSTNLKKQNTKPLSEIVENYEEVAGFIEDQRYQKNYPIKKKEENFVLETRMASPAYPEKSKLGIWNGVFRGAELWIKTSWYVLWHHRTPKRAKWLVIAAAIYLVSPFDFILDTIPVVGYFDDLLVISVLVWFAIKLTPKDVLEECYKQAIASKNTVIVG